MLLSEDAKAALVDSLHNWDYSVNGQDFKTFSMRANEMTNKLSDERKGYGTVKVDFPGEDVRRKFMGDVLQEISSNTYGDYIEYGQDMRAEVMVHVRAKEMHKNGVRLHPRKITEAILNIIWTKIRKNWNGILKDYNAMIDFTRGHVYRDLTKFVRADGYSERFIRFWIAYSDTWNETDDGEAMNEPTRGIMIDAMSDASTESFTFGFVIEED